MTLPPAPAVAVAAPTSPRPPLVMLEDTAMASRLPQRSLSALRPRQELVQTPMLLVVCGRGTLPLPTAPKLVTTYVLTPR